MGTRTTDRNTKEVKFELCDICGQTPAPDCAWRQGRCPHREPAWIELMILKFLDMFRKHK